MINTLNCDNSNHRNLVQTRLKSLTKTQKVVKIGKATKNEQNLRYRISVANLSFILVYFFFAHNHCLNMSFQWGKLGSCCVKFTLENAPNDIYRTSFLTYLKDCRLYLSLRKIIHSCTKSRIDTFLVVIFLLYHNPILQVTGESFTAGSKILTRTNLSYCF